MNVFVLLNTERGYSEECGKQSSICFSSYRSQWCPKTAPITNYLQNIFLCVQNKDIKIGLELNEGVWMMIFGWTIPLSFLNIIKDQITLKKRSITVTGRALRSGLRTANRRQLCQLSIQFEFCSVSVRSNL